MLVLTRSHYYVGVNSVYRTPQTEKIAKDVVENSGVPTTNADNSRSVISTIVEHSRKTTNKERQED